MLSISTEVNNDQVTITKNSYTQDCDRVFQAGISSDPKTSTLTYLIQGDRSGTFEVIGYEDHPANSIKVYTDTDTITLNEDGINIKSDKKITFLVGGQKITISDSEINLESSSDIVINGGKVTASGDFVTAAGTSLDAVKAFFNSHVHTSANPGNPTTPPTVIIP